uniref:ACB domain-containing protein n=1 Tax=Meloidogyne floridensis TaxID=298350 RepID=A0A915NUC9_9BILA
MLFLLLLSTPSTSTTSPPDPIPARIPRPKIARYSPNVAHAETPDEEAEAADRLTPLRSEMRSLSSGGWGGGSSSPRMSQRSLIFRTHVGDTLEEEDDEYLDNFQGGVLDSDRLKQHNRHHLPILSADNIVDEDVSPSSPSSSSNSDGGRTYEMSEEESSEFFELSAPLQDALETINDHLMQEAMKTSLKMGEKSEKQQQEQQPKNNQLEWAYKYAQHEWLKMATKKNTNAEAVEQFIDALESYSTQLMDTVMRNIC